MSAATSPCTGTFDADAFDGRCCATDADAFDGHAFNDQTVKQFVVLKQFVNPPSEEEGSTTIQPPRLQKRRQLLLLHLW